VCKYELHASGLSKVIVRHTDRSGQTDRHTDRESTEIIKHATSWVLKNVKIAMHCHLRPIDAAPVVMHFNYDADATFEVAAPSR